MPYKNILIALASNCIEDCGILNIQTTEKSEKQIGNDLPSVVLRQTGSLVCFYMVRLGIGEEVSQRILIPLS